jgi:polyisoprenyl-phosphate glycosyltransferase
LAESSAPLMVQFPVFLSVVVVVRNQSTALASLLTDATAAVAPLVSDYELIVVDNGSDDQSVSILQHLTTDGIVANLQVYALTKEVDQDTAAWAGLENALGDFIAVIDPMTDDFRYIATMLDQAVNGADAVFARNLRKPPQTLAYRVCLATFNLLYASFQGIQLTKEAPQFRILSRRVANFILQHSVPALMYRHLPATAGFARVNLSYQSDPRPVPPKRLIHSIDRGMRSLVSTTRGPMRLVTSLCLFGALSNLIYSVYVVAIALFKPNVQPGWTTLSLQQSGMFFLLSLVLLILGEYVLHMARLSNEGPPYHVAREFTSRVITRRGKLNVEDISLIGGGLPAPRNRRLSSDSR